MNTTPLYLQERIGGVNTSQIEEKLPQMLDDMTSLLVPIAKKHEYYFDEQRRIYEFLKENLENTTEGHIQFPWWLIIAMMRSTIERVNYTCAPYVITDDATENIAIIQTAHQLLKDLTSPLSEANKLIEKAAKCLTDNALYPGVSNTLNVEDPRVENILADTGFDIVKTFMEKPFANRYLPCKVSALKWDDTTDAGHDIDDLMFKSVDTVTVNIKEKTVSANPRPIKFHSWASLMLTKVDGEGKRTFLNRVSVNKIEQNAPRATRLGITIDIPDKHLRLFAGLSTKAVHYMESRITYGRDPFEKTEPHINEPQLRRDIEHFWYLAILRPMVYLAIIEMNLYAHDTVAIDDVSLDGSLTRFNIEGTLPDAIVSEYWPYNYTASLAAVEINKYALTNKTRVGTWGVNLDIPSDSPANLIIDHYIDDIYWDDAEENINALIYKRTMPPYVPILSKNPNRTWDKFEAETELKRQMETTDITAAEFERIRISRLSRALGERIYDQLAADVCNMGHTDPDGNNYWGADAVRQWYKNTLGEMIFQNHIFDKALIGIWDAYIKGKPLPLSFVRFEKKPAKAKAGESIDFSELIETKLPTYRITFTPESDMDLQELFDYIAEVNDTDPVIIPQCLIGWVSRHSRPYAPEQNESALNGLANPLSPGGVNTVASYNIKPYHKAKCTEPINSFDFHIDITKRAMRAFARDRKN